jgi:SAM-dependent methyltransferase
MSDEGKKFWTQNSDVYFEVSNIAKTISLYPALLNIASDLHGKRILDFGCGDGTLSAKFAQAGGMVTAVDQSLAGITRAKELHEKRHRQIKFKHIIPPDYTFIEDSGPFDMVIFSLVLDTVPTSQELLELLKFAFRITVKGGKMLIGESHPCFRNHNFGLVSLDLKPEQYKIPGTTFQVKICGGKKNHKNIHFTVYHYPLDTLTGSIGEAGFLTHRLHEVYDIGEMNDISEKQHYFLDENTPRFLIIDAVKI